jgi:hypothetical protein
MTFRSGTALLLLAWVIFAGSNTLAQKVQAPFVVIEAQVPKYAPLARTAGVSGTVTVDVHVEKGVVTTAAPRSGPPLLFEETVRSIKTWTLDPGIFLIIGRPQESCSYPRRPARRR